MTPPTLVSHKSPPMNHLAPYPRLFHLPPFLRFLFFLRSLRFNRFLLVLRFLRYFAPRGFFTETPPQFASAANLPPSPHINLLTSFVSLHFLAYSTFVTSFAFFSSFTFFASLPSSLSLSSWPLRLCPSLRSLRLPSLTSRSLLSPLSLLSPPSEKPQGRFLQFLHQITSLGSPPQDFPPLICSAPSVPCHLSA